MVDKAALCSKQGVHWLEPCDIHWELRASAGQLAKGMVNGCTCWHHNHLWLAFCSRHGLSRFYVHPAKGFWAVGLWACGACITFWTHLVPWQQWLAAGGIPANLSWFCCSRKDLKHVLCSSSQGLLSCGPWSFWCLHYFLDTLAALTAMNCSCWHSNQPQLVVLFKEIFKHLPCSSSQGLLSCGVGLGAFGAWCFPERPVQWTPRVDCQCLAKTYLMPAGCPCKGMPLHTQAWLPDSLCGRCSICIRCGGWLGSQHVL